MTGSIERQPRSTAARFSRRKALSALAATAGSGGAIELCARGAAAQSTPATTPVSALKELPQPTVIRSVDGVLATTLNARPAVVDMHAPQPVSTWTYDGVVPGHTWDIRPGDTLRIDVVNDLPAMPEHDVVDLVRPHEWTTTNLHTHGLHVSPLGNSDNVFLEIAPGETFQYEIAVPQHHTGGMFLYHPHKHGGVCQQVRAGMVGALIVRGEIDEVPEVAAAKEQILVLQAIELGDDYQLMDPIPHPSSTESFFPRTQILYTVNGVLNPRVTMYPGEVQRWRMLNAAEGKFMSLRLAEHDLNVIAWDGLTLAEPDPVSEVLMAPANRVEVLIQAGEPGIYELVLTPGSSQKPVMTGMNHGEVEATPNGSPSPELVVRPILTIEVIGTGPEMALPRELPAWDPPIRPIARTRQFAYTVERGADGVTFLDFGIDGKPFNPANAPYRMKLGTAEEWTLTNGKDDKLPEHAHALHIHVNPFKVTKVNGQVLETPMWRDTFILTGETGDSFTFEMNFEDFTGKFVEHCHVLSHEDLGMMEALEIVP